jgi:DNA-binding CsgD family transcriptional regulator
MITDKDYTLFQQFIDKYIDQGFQNINREDPFMVEMESTLSARKQFFYIGDLIHIRVIFTSKGSMDMIGIDPATLEPGSLYKATHPSDLHRMNLARLRLFKTGTELLEQKTGPVFYSIPFYLIGKDGQPIHVLFQGYIFYSKVPHETVFVLFVHTDISNLQIHKHLYHHYIGNDASVFRVPDESLLDNGYTFSDREFEILQLLALGMDSDKIAEKLFLSTHTVNTHRRNLLKKTNKSFTHELVIELMEKGIL